MSGAIGIIGGSGLYALEGIAEIREEGVTTPFGEPSAAPLRGRVGGVDVVFIARHGRGHRYLPSEVNYRANICALKQLGAERVISVSAVGSMREAIRPGDIVIPDQYIDRTVRRESTFFGQGIVGHVGFADPVCPELTASLHAAARKADYVDGGAGDRGVARTDEKSRVWRGGTYLGIEGPQFSTRAESLLYRSWKVDVIGMTAVTEAKLAREAELCFASVALSTDYDCWHPAEAAVSAASVVAVLGRNIAGAKRVLETVLPSLAAERGCSCGSAAQNAVMTARDAIPSAAIERLRPLLGRHIS